MPWTFPWTEFLKKRACRYLLQHYLGQFLKEKLSLDQLSVDLYNGRGSIKDLELDVEVPFIFWVVGALFNLNVSWVISGKTWTWGLALFCYNWERELKRAETIIYSKFRWIKKKLISFTCAIKFHLRPPMLNHHFKTGVFFCPVDMQVGL